MKKNFKIKTTAMDNRAKDVIKLLDELPSSEALPVKIVFALDKRAVRFYTETPGKENQIGILPPKSEILSDINKVFANEADGQVYITGYENGLFDAVMEIREAEKATVVKDTEIDAAVNKKIAEGIITEEEALEKVQIMQKNGVKKVVILAVVNSWELYKNVKRPGTIYVDPDPNNAAESLFNVCISNAVVKNPIIYEGDKSLGKNVCAETVAYCMNLPYYCVTFNRMMTEEDIYGGKATDNSAAAELNREMAKSYIRYMSGEQELLEEAADYELLKTKAVSVSIVNEISAFVRCMDEGGVIVFNEMNLADPNFLSGFTNPITDGTGFLDIAGVRHHVHKNFVLIGTQNANYTGTCTQNEATMSRFGCVQFKRSTSIVKQLRAAVGESVDQKYLEQADTFYKLILDSVSKGIITDTAVNIRGIVRALKMIALLPGVSKLKSQLQTHVINNCPEEERGLILTILNQAVSL